MPKGSEALTQARKETILNACEMLYETMSFKEITIKEIGKVTPFTRTTIYNYFQTKEEIFLALLEREFERWNAALEVFLEKDAPLDRDALAEILARTLSERPLLLKILSMNMYDIEENSCVEALVDFKRAFGASLVHVDALLERLSPVWSAEARKSFIYSFFPFIYGIYPYTHLTDKQHQAMVQAQVPEPGYSVYDLTLAGARRLLGLDV